ncbi:MAG: 2-oxoacid:ferredoxin oxidoreductase subunit beta [Bdellovibrionales bacterium]|nr:2-oxoacid:ferredoxin oxidoreductase subunit beta [Bdellovibrionales bacterium]
MSNVIQTEKLTKKDFATDQDVRWCPGCGDYSILANVQKVMPELGVARENIVFVSGIGCSSRFPYYMNTYGFHTIHGRAPALATGIKTANPDLSVWMVTGDGDALSIGGNHIIHALRRNLDIVVLLFNNRIYGLTKGQYSPTSEVGKVTKSTPFGSVDQPINPLTLALGANASFVARTLDVDAKHSLQIFEEANNHRGTSFIEIYQNCNIFNDGTFDSVRDRASRVEHQLLVEHGQPLIFGKDRDRGISISAHGPEVISFAANDEQAAIAAGVTVFDRSNRLHAHAIAEIDRKPEFPVAMGVFYQQKRDTFDAVMQGQFHGSDEEKPSEPHDIDATLSDLFQTGDTWMVG